MDRQPAADAATLVYALYFASQGRPVLPIPPRSKKPIMRNWPAAATTDPEKVTGWFRRQPNCNYGIACGDSLCVVDVDLPDGQGFLDQYETKLPDSWVFRTGGGGLHYVFKAPKGGVGNAVRVTTGVDIRGKGGMIVGPGSYHPNGQRYAIISGPDHTRLAAVPPCVRWLLSSSSKPTGASRSPRQEPTTSSWHAMVRAGVAKGARNDAIARLSGYLLRLNVDPRLALELMLAVNVARFSPPLPEAEVRRTVDSIARRELECRL
jgi:hypothetical protein